MNILKRKSKKNLIWIISTIVFLSSALTLPGCSKNTIQDTPVTDYAEIFREDTASYKEEGPVEKENDYTEEITGNEQEGEKYLSEEELLKYRPNELGQVMILMYHQIGETESEWVRTPGNFRKDLKNLYQNGYRLVNLLDYVKGGAEVEAGKSPVIITFDDGTQDHLNFIDAGDNFKLDPDCAVAILEDFCSDYPDFGRGATFYIYYPNPFRQEQYLKEKLEFLANNGYEIGNHTYSHADLSLLDDEGVAREIALNAREISDNLAEYRVRSLALPYGQYPQNKDILAGGEYMDFSYINEAVLLVGSNPAPSPFSKEFDPLSIPRIRASETMVENSGLYDWLDYFKSYPGQRYISDGNSSTVTAPRELMDKLDSKSAADREVYFY